MMNSAEKYSRECFPSHASNLYKELKREKEGEGIIKKHHIPVSMLRRAHCILLVGLAHELDFGERKSPKVLGSSL